MKVDTVESLEAEFSALMDQHDGSFAGNPSLAEMRAEDAAWQRTLDIKSRIDSVIGRLDEVLRAPAA